MRQMQSTKTELILSIFFSKMNYQATKTSMVQKAAVNSFLQIENKKLPTIMTESYLLHLYK